LPISRAESCRILLCWATIMLKFFENKLALICATVVVISILAAVVLVFRSSNQRYYLAPGKNGIAYKIDRKTGKTWFVRGTSLREIEESQPERQLSALPESMVASLTGTAGYSVRSLFSGLGVCLSNNF